VDLDPGHAFRARPLGIAADAARLPLADSSFDFVLCLDTLEHIDPAHRAAVIGELGRVCANKLVIGLPMGAFAAWGDEQYFQYLRSRNVAVPGWLAEHRQMGIPSVGSILRDVQKTGREFRLHGNETVIQHYAGLLADEVRFLAEANMMLSHKHVDAPPIACGEGDLYYSYFVEVGGRAAVAGSTAPANRRGRTDGEISLYCVGHDPARFLPLAGHRHFFVGRQVPAAFGPTTTFLCDDQEHSIAERNPVYSELTAIYSVWKNSRHGDYVGFCHYRRLFHFLGDAATQRNNDISSREAFERARPAMEAVSSCRDFLAAGGVVVASEDFPPPTVAEQYMHAHFPDHYLIAINSVLEHYPHLAPYVVRQFESRRCYMNNMFICSATFFDELCTWWFDTLFRIEALLPRPRDPYQQRTMAFLSERLFDIYLRWRFATGTARRELPIFCVTDTTFS